METEPKFQKFLEKPNLYKFVAHLDNQDSPTSSAILAPTTTYGVYIHKESSFFHTCLCGSTDFIKHGVNKSHNQRFKCTHCGSSRVLSIHVFNIDLAFNTLYEKRFPALCMQRTKHQKITAFKHDKKTITFFNACIQQLSKDGLEAEEVMELAFNMTCLQIEDLSWKLVKQTNDDWYFLQNWHDSDVQYALEGYIIKLIRTHGIHDQVMQDTKVPLLFCAECDSRSIQRYNYNNNGRRTITCKECGQRSIVRVKNLIPKFFFDQYYHYWFNQLSDDDTLVTEAINCFREDFYDSPIYPILEKILSKQMIITISLRDDLLNAFQIIQRSRINISEVGYTKKEALSYLDILSIPKDYADIKNLTPYYQFMVEVFDKNLYNWEKRAEDAFKMLIDMHKRKVISR